MKTLLIYPPFHRLHGIKNRFFPIGLGYLAGALRNKNKEAAIYNAENFDDNERLIGSYSHSDSFRFFQAYQHALDYPDHYIWKEVKDVITSYKPDVVGITTKSCMIPSAQMVSKITKQISSKIKVVWGGPHASISSSQIIAFENVDFVLRNEGEKSIVEFVEMLESGRDNWSTIDGLVWKDKTKKVVHNKDRMNVSDIDEIPYPDKSADLMPSRYKPNDYGVMFASRGCPWPCTFCDSRGVWSRKTRYRSPQNIVKEMIQLYELYGVRDYYFWDDTFTPYKNHSMQLFELIIETFQKKKHHISWMATTRCDCVDEELAHKMKESGCRLLTFGIETGSPKMMEILRKGITHDKVLRCQRVLSKVGIVWDAFFMIGFPDDTQETIEETMDLIRRLKCGSVSIGIFTPYPGTELHERAKQYGLIKEPIEWRYFSHQSPMNHFVKNISRDEFAQIARRCLVEIDHQNARRYHLNRLRSYAKRPSRIPGKLWQTVKEACSH